MGFHTFDPEMADKLEDPMRFRFCSREELLESLPRDPDARILDVGSGTGFYTSELAPLLGTVIGMDLEPTMHQQFLANGKPENVSLVTATATLLPFGTASFDGAFSTMTFHESTDENSIAELARVLRPDARVVIVDWSATGRGTSGPPLSERFDAANAREYLQDAGFEICQTNERSETFKVVATA